LVNKYKQFIEIHPLRISSVVEGFEFFGFGFDKSTTINRLRETVKNVYYTYTYTYT